MMKGSRYIANLEEREGERLADRGTGIAMVSEEEESERVFRGASSASSRKKRKRI